MKKITLLVAIVLLANISVFSKGRISAYSMSVYEQYMNSGSDNIPVKSILKKQGKTTVSEAFVQISSPETVESLKNAGVSVSGVFGDVVTVTLPVENLEKIADMDGVEWIELAKKVDTKNDIARSFFYTNHESVQKGVGLDRPYKGAGVIYGSLDMGVDFNHIAFKNQATGESRILYAYLPTNYTGQSPVGNVYDLNGNMTKNGKFPGSEFTKEQIATLTTDTRGESHGTHTFGIGAGGYMGNPYYGMAPSADIIACATSDLTDVTVVNSVSYILGKAKELNKPVVVNLSLGINVGPHDGTSFVPKILDCLAGEGKVIVLASGNEGDLNMHIYGNLKTPGTEMKTFIGFNEGRSALDYQDLSSGYGTNDFDIWSRDDKNFSVKIVVFDTQSNSVIYEFQPFAPSKEGNSFSVNTKNGNSEACKFINGRLQLYGSYNGRKYNVYGGVDLKLKNPSYRLGIVTTSNEGAEVDMWTDCYGIEFGNDGVEGYLKGSADMSINDWATGQNTISVGAYVSRKSWKSVDGREREFSNSNIIQDDVVYFSSYGVDANGISRPDIVAPGFFLISSINSFDSSYNKGSYSYTDLAIDEIIGGNRYKWGLMYGTSMAAPCVAGIIATWLEANPNLTAHDIKKAFSASAMKDNYVTGGVSEKWGYGKINAYGGLQEVLKNASVDYFEDKVKPLIVFPNPNNGQFELTLPSSDNTITVNVYNLNGILVATQTYTNDGNVLNVDFSNCLTSGIYLLQILTDLNAYSSRLVVE